MKTIHLLVIAGLLLFNRSCSDEYTFVPPVKQAEIPAETTEDRLKWGSDFFAPGGGYPRMAEGADGTLFLGMDTGEGIKMMKSTDNGATWTDKTVAVPNPPGVNEQVGNVFPLVLPNGDILVAYRHLNDIDKYDKVADGIHFYNIGISKSTDGGLTWQEVSRVLDWNRQGDRSMGAWEPYLFQFSENEVGCFYARQNAGRDSHPLYQEMKRSTDGGMTWGAKETVVGTDQFGPEGSAGMCGAVRTSSGKVIAVFETQDHINHNWFSIGKVVYNEEEKTWSEISSVYSYPLASNVYGAGAPYIAELPDGTLMVTYQHGKGGEDTQFGYVLSKDSGVTWGENWPLWPGYRNMWNAVFVSSKGLIYALTSGVKYKIGIMDGDAAVKSSFYLFAKHTEETVVDANIPVPAGNNNVHTWAFQPGVEQQMWLLHDQGDGSFWLEPTSSSNYNRGKSLEIATDGSNIKLGSFAGNNNQLWTAEAMEDGYYKIISKSGDVALTVTNDGTSNGTNLIAETFTGAMGQQFMGVSSGHHYDPFSE